MSIYQNAGPKADEIRQLLLSEGVLFKEFVRKRHRNPEIEFRIKQESSNYFREHVYNIDGYKKTPKRELLFAEEQKLKAMFDALISGDGHRRKDGRVSFIQKNKRVVDFMQELCTLLGMRSIVTRRKQGTYSVFITNKRYIGLRKTDGTGISKTHERYIGIVWCPNTDNGTFVARRNGSVFITGNTFPENLIIDCIKAGTSEHGRCNKCGRPWVRIVEKELKPTAKVSYGTQQDHRDDLADPNSQSSNRIKDGHVPGMFNEYTTTGWKPSCHCKNADIIPDVCLDPFMGAGTTALVAKKLQRNFIGVELNEKYTKEIAIPRLKDELGMFYHPQTEFE